MIRELMPMLRLGRPLTFTISAVDAKTVRVCFIPEPMDGDTQMHDHLKIPLKLEGTPEDLDRALSSALQTYSDNTLSIADQIAEVAAAQAAAKEKVKSSTTKGSAASATRKRTTAATTKKNEPTSQTSVLDELIPPPEKKAADKARKSVEAALAGETTTTSD